MSWFSVTIGLAIAVLCAWYCRRLAMAKGLNVPLWTVLGFVFTVLAVPVLVLLPLETDGDAAQPGASGSQEASGASASQEASGASASRGASGVSDDGSEESGSEESRGEQLCREEPHGEGSAAGASSPSPGVK